MLGTCYSLLSAFALSMNAYPKIFELITGSALFKHVPYPKYSLDEPNIMLHQMICYTGEDFGSQQLSVSPLTGQFLDSTCACAFLNPNVVAHLPFHRLSPIALSTYPSRSSKL